MIGYSHNTRVKYPRLEDEHWAFTIFGRTNEKRLEYENDINKVNIHIRLYLVLNHAEIIVTEDMDHDFDFQRLRIATKLIYEYLLQSDIKYNHTPSSRFDHVNNS